MTTEELKEIARVVEQELAKRTQTVEELPTSDNLADFVTLPVLGRDGSMKTLKEKRVIQDRQDLAVRRVLLAHKVCKDHEDCRAFRVIRVNAGRRVIRGSAVPTAACTWWTTARGRQRLP